MGRKGPMSQRVPQWSESRYWTFIRSALRAAWNRYPAKYAVIMKGRKEVEGKRHRYELQCVECEGWFQQKDIQVDHIVPAGSLKTFDDLPRFVDNLFCGPDNLQILCKECHKIKTIAERNKENEDE